MARWSLGLLLVVACGGRVNEGGDAGATNPGLSNSDASDGGTGASDASFPVCPANPPQVGSACDPAPDNICVYGFAGDPTCMAFVCDASGRWHTTPEGC